MLLVHMINTNHLVLLCVKSSDQLDNKQTANQLKALTQSFVVDVGGRRSLVVKDSGKGPNDVTGTSLDRGNKDFDYYKRLE